MTGVWSILLGAALEAGLSLLAEAGFGDQVHNLKERLTGHTQKARRAAFKRAFQKAKDTVDEDVRRLLDHQPFQEAVIAGLLDPAVGFDWRAAVEGWEDELPPSYIPSLRRFFNTLEMSLMADEVWGPIVERYQALRFRRDVMEELEKRNLAFSPGRIVSMVHAELQGSGAIAQGDGAVAAGDGGMAIAGNVDQAVHIVIQELKVQYTPPTPVGPTAEDLRERYLSELARDANRLPWTTVEPKYAHPEHGEALGLAEVYTALDTTELEHVEREEELRQFLAEAAQDESQRIPAQATVNREARLVVLGDPGSGKSTFVKHLAYTLAQANLADDPASWLERMVPWDHGPLLPVWVELRALAAYAEETGRKAANLLLGYLQHNLEEWELSDFWPTLDKIIRDGDEVLLVLLDGLDEVPADLRSGIVRAMQDFADRYRCHRYVVTCRPYAYIDQACQMQGFKEVTLAPFSAKQIDQFITTWYRKLALRGRLSSREVEHRAGKLQRAVQRRDLRELAQRPLLLTVMTLLNTFRGQLPQDRTELYASTIDLLLHRWEARTGEEEGIVERLDISQLKMSDLEAGLYAVAFHVHSEIGEANGTTAADVDEADLRKWLAPYLGNDWNKAGEFVDYIRKRAGLLIRHKRNAYTFPHRTFQEFMAACHLLNMPDYPKEATRLVRNELTRWRQVFILAAGHAARTHQLVQAISAVNALCPRDVRSVKSPDAAAYRRAQLAGAALLEIGLVGVQREEVGQAVLARTQEWLVAAMKADQLLEPKERVMAGNTLAGLGDPRFRKDAWYLPDSEQLGFVEIPEGSFLMGSESSNEAVKDEHPQHEVVLPTYYVACYPVTVAQFHAFVEASEYVPKDPHAYLRNPDNHPVANVTWYDALAYCEWLTEKLRDWEEMPEPLGSLLRDEGWTVTLPSEAEWEKAARGVDGRVYPWGDEVDPNRANYRDTGIGDTGVVGCFPQGASPYGILDMAGSIWEWTRSLYEDYLYVLDGREDLMAGRDFPRVLRGGAFTSTTFKIRCAVRYWLNPGDRFRSYGFRVCIAPRQG